MARNTPVIRLPTDTPFNNVVFPESDLSDGLHTIQRNWPESHPNRNAFPNIVFSDDDINEDPASFISNWHQRQTNVRPFINTVFSDDELDGGFETNWPTSRGFTNIIFPPEDDPDDFGPNYPTEEQVRRAQYVQPQQHTSHSIPPVGQASGRNPPLENTTRTTGRRRREFFQSLLQDPQSAVTKEDLAILAELIYEQTAETQRAQDSQARQILGLRGQAQEPVGRPVVRADGRRSNKVVPRDAETKQFQSRIREAAFECMGRVPTENDDPTPIISATSDEVKRFLENPTNPALGPQSNNLILDFNDGSGKSSRWNKKAASIFTQIFMRTYDQYDANQVNKAFRTHIFQLKNQYKAYSRFLVNSTAMGRQADIPTANEDNIYSSRISRRRNLLHRRSAACEAYRQYADVGRFCDLWKTMPFEAMSGDETDHHNGQPRYVITTLPWRASWVRQWMQVFDRLHLTNRFNAAGRATPGAFPHIRLSGNRERIDRECVTVPVGMPQNFYCPRWLSTQTEQAIADLNMQPPIDPQFSRYIARVALTCRNVISHQTRPIPLQDIPEAQDQIGDSL